jgi:protein-S-isoprenylcysteine O-methyltransferase Ste14
VLVQYAVTPVAVPFDRPISAIGGVFILGIGVALIVSARTLHVRTGQNPAPWKPSPELILTGPYRLTRNPMYVGLTIVQIGLGVALNNLWVALFALPALLTVHVIAVLPEEKYLAEKFGETYTAYRGRVRRYL